MSLFRVGIVIAAGIALMPSDERQQARLYEQAAAATHWTVTYCDRNAEHCARASEAWTAFLAKARFAAKAAADLYERHATSTPTATATATAVPPAPSPPPAPPALPATRQSARGTLTAADLAQPWRGSTAR